MKKYFKLSMRMKQLSKGNCLWVILLLFSWATKAQVTGSSPAILASDEMTIGFMYDLDQLGDPAYVYTMIPTLEGSLFTGTVSWTSSDETVATIDQDGVVKIVGFGFIPVVFKAVATSSGHEGLVATTSVDFSPNGGYDMLTDIAIIGVTEIDEREESMIEALVFPSGRRDNSAIFTSSDPSIASVSNRRLTAHKEGVVRISVVSSLDASLTSSLTLTVHNVADLVSPTITIENYFSGNEISLQRSSTLTIPSATAEDDVYGTLPVTITETGTPFEGTLIGDYPVRYYAIDPENNATEINLVLKVIDSLPPQINFAEASLTVSPVLFANQGEGLNIPAVTAIDDDGATVSVTIDRGGFDPDVIGSYTVTYTATDMSSNTTIANVFLEIEPGNPPIISLDGYSSGDVISFNQTDVPYTVPSATASDALGNSVYVWIDYGALNSSIIGEYTVTYTATDTFDMTTQSSLTIRVTDAIAPVITNKDEIEYLFRILDPSVETLVGTVSATDNVGVASYTLTEITSREFPRGGKSGTVTIEGIVLGGGSGNVRIDASGNIYATAPIYGGFHYEEEFYFIIDAFDANGNKDSTYMALTYAMDMKPSVRLKEFQIDNWTEVGYNAMGTYSVQKQDNTAVNTALAYINTTIAPYTFESISISGVGASDFVLIQDASVTGSATLQLVNAFDLSRQASYTLTLQVNGRLGIGAIAVVSEVDFTIQVKTSEQLSPALTDLKDLVKTGVGATADFTLRNLFKATGAIAGFAGMPDPTPEVLGPIDDVLDIYLSGLPLIEQGIDAVGAKRLIKLSPYALWISIEDQVGGKITRVFVKFQKGPVSVQIEFVIDEVKNGSYWLTTLGSSARGAGFQPSSVHSSLSFLDHAEGGIVFTSTNVTKSDFKCLPLPSDLQLAAGIHLVAKGNLVPGGYTPFFNPKADFRIGLSEAGFTVPDLVANIGFDARFQNDFNLILHQTIVELSNTAQQGLRQGREAVAEARRNIWELERVFRWKKRSVQSVKNRINYLQGPFDAAQAAVQPAQDALDAIESQIADLRDDEICTPSDIPYYYPSWCGCCSPCIKKGYIHIPDFCGPNLVSRAAAFALEPTRWILLRALQTANRAVDAARLSIEAAELVLSGIELAIEESKRSIDIAKLALIALEESLALTEAGLGKLGEAARFVLDRLGTIISVDRVAFETKLSVASSGSIAGKLSFDFVLFGQGGLSKEVDFSFDDPVDSAKNIAAALVN